MDLFIADTHLGHENILVTCRPQFQTIEQMNALIIQNINEKMTKRDTLYIVGDFSYRSDYSSVIGFLEAIKPKKVLIKGNHDPDWLRRFSDQEIDRYFEGVYEQYGYKKFGIEVHLNHFPQLAWSRSHYFAQSFSICGHIHNDRNVNLAARLFDQVNCQFNAGVDIHDFYPVTFAELVENNTRFYQRQYTEQEQELLEAAIKKLMS